MKLQSAMEYLMTYGWAILIIAIALGALYTLGIFNPSTLAPKAPPGSCQVIRPEGAGTTSFINLEGICNNELPEYVAQISTDTDYVSLPALNSKLNSNITIVAWIIPTKETGNPLWNWVVNVGGTACTGTGLSLAVTQSYYIIADGMCDSFTPSSGATAKQNAWNFAALALNGETISIDTNNNWNNGTLASPITFGTGASIGGLGSGPLIRWFNGSIANVQIYNTSLSGVDLNALYQEGIGGVPINIQNLVAWYPLNGNANDYSGNSYNGHINGNLQFSGSWASAYTAP